jgi:hypothetical protein
VQVKDTHFVGSVVLRHFLAENENTLIALHFLVNRLIQGIANCEV